MDQSRFLTLESQAARLRTEGRFCEALDLLSELVKTGLESSSTWRSLLELGFIAGKNTGVQLATALRKFPRDATLASHAVLFQLEQRQPGQARRTAFKERLLNSVGKQSHSELQSNGNLLACYDQTGRSDLVSCLHSSVSRKLSEQPSVQANLVLQLASLTSEAYPIRVQTHAEGFHAKGEISKGFIAARSRGSTLRVGLVGPDFYYHPVGRFVHMLLSAKAKECKPEIHLINTGGNLLPQLKGNSSINVLTITDQNHHDQLNTIRRLDLDIAIDLAGWTGKNNGWLFSQRLAPLQVNYLGYFASSGLPSMDAWLGDAVVFPKPMHEWHSERIIRLNRPFLAWQPTPDLPEGRVEVPAPPNGGPVFGCFNHVRKLSSATLQLWARILNAVASAKLALKAFTSDDPAVKQLLEQRMRRFGLNPEAVIWLPTCPKPEDHLGQYGLVDIALDPFPNGGCTTTCEALWMGVPVITWCGSHYVSRMSAAVLIGANLPEWVAYSEAEYLELAVKAAANVQALRANRPQLRVHLQNSPLGDAADLSTQLWSCLEQLV